MTASASVFDSSRGRPLGSTETERIFVEFSPERIREAIELLQIAEQYGYTHKDIVMAVQAKKKNAQNTAEYYAAHKAKLNRQRAEYRRAAQKRKAGQTQETHGQST